MFAHGSLPSSATPSSETIASFFEAIDRNSFHSTKVVGKLLRQNPRLAEARRNGLTGLMLATQLGNLGLVNKLISRSDATALSTAAHFARAGQTDAWPAGFSALMIAATRGWLEGVQALLPRSNAQQVNRRQRNALMQAAAHGHLLCVEALLSHTPLSHADDDGCDALMLAVGASSPEAARACVERLLPHCDSTAEDWKGCTALWHATRRATEEDFSLVRLLGAQSDPLHLTSDGKHALALAREKGIAPLTAWLEALPDRPAFVQRRQEALLFREAMAAIHSNDVHALALHLQAWPALALVHDRAMGQHQTALMRAAHLGHAACVQALVPVSVCDARNGRGETALMLAARAGHLRCLQVLASRSDARLVSNTGMTPLLYAIEGNHCDCAIALLGASDLTVLFHDRSPHGGSTTYTPLMRAVLHGQSPVVEALVKQQAIEPGSADADAAFSLAVTLVQIHKSQSMAVNDLRHRRWSCVDLLALVASAALTRERLEGVDLRLLPQFSAQVERDTLLASVALRAAPPTPNAVEAAPLAVAPEDPLSLAPLLRRSMRL